MTREDWLQERRKSLGGSDMGAVLGLNRWRSPYTVWAEKCGMLEDQPDSEAMRIGRDLEPYVLQRFQEASGYKTKHVNAIIRNSSFPHLHANVDSMVVGQSAGVEAKTASALNARVFRDGEFPATYYAQCVTYLAVTNSARWYLAVLVMGREFKIYQLTRIEDDLVPEWCESSVYVPQAEIDALNDAANAFWERVENGDPPPTDETKSTTDTLDSIYHADEEEADLEALEATVSLLLEVTAKMKELKELSDGYKNEIKGFMKEASAGRSSLAKITWREQGKRSFDAKKLEEDHPELDLSPYYKTTISRVFRVSPVKTKGEE